MSRKDLVTEPLLRFLLDSDETLDSILNKAVDNSKEKIVVNRSNRNEGYFFKMLKCLKSQFQVIERTKVGNQHQGRSDR